MRGMDNRELGRQGERIAREYLEGLGYEILDMNFYASHKEIDIIALDNEYIVFVEVKCRTKNKKRRFHRPSVAVGREKRSNIVEAANRFISENINDPRLLRRPSRVDVIEVTVPPLEHRFKDAYTLTLSACAINHIRNAFYSDCTKA